MNTQVYCKGGLSEADKRIYRICAGVYESKHKSDPKYPAVFAGSFIQCADDHEQLR